MVGDFTTETLGVNVLEGGGMSGLKEKVEEVVVDGKSLEFWASAVFWTLVRWDFIQFLLNLDFDWTQLKDI